MINATFVRRSSGNIFHASPMTGHDRGPESPCTQTHTEGELDDDKYASVMIKGRRVVGFVS